jgi:hypothetical protein
MSYPEAEIVEQGRDAWRRLQQSQRTAWQDWARVGHALLILRRDTMLETRANRPMGWRYNAAFGAALKANGLDGISGQDRYKIIQCLEHEIEIEQWRATLDEKQRLRLNHPNAIWAHFTKAFAPGKRIEPRKTASKPKVRGYKPRPNYWSQDVLRRTAEGIRMANSNDIFRVARAALDAAFPTRDSLLEAGNEPRPNPSRADRAAQLEEATA